jgi:Flp pilus assembly protein TadB
MAEPAGIIDTIQSMVSNGESEESILSTLKTMGVTEKQAKRLLLVGQAQTFKALERDISSIVQKELAKNMKEHIKLLAQQARETGKINKQLVLQEVKKYVQNISGLERFERETLDRVIESEDHSQEALGKTLVMQKRMKTLEKDLNSLKEKHVGLRKNVFMMLLLSLGIVFAAATVYIIFNDPAKLNENILLVGVLGVLAITSMFISTRV